MTIVHTGKGLEIRDIINGYLVRRYYIGYTIEEARRLFTREFKQELIVQRRG